MKITLEVPEPKFTIGDRVICVRGWTQRGVVGRVIARYIELTRIDEEANTSGMHWAYLVSGAMDVQPFIEDQIEADASVGGGSGVTG